MATKIKLTHPQYKDWRQNISHLIDSEGEFFRFATNEEQHGAYVFAEEQKTLRNQTRNPDRGPLKPYEVTIDEKNYQVIPHREVVSARLLSEFGEVILVDPSNRRLKNIRDPEKIPMPYEQSMGTMPPGDNCSECTSWPGRPPGRHHPACPWSKKEREQVMGTGFGVQTTPNTQNPVPKTPHKPDMNFAVKGSTHHVAPSNGPTTGISGAVVDPSGCICKEWAGTPTGGHHSICQNAEAWNAYQASKIPESRVQNPVQSVISNLESDQVEAVDVYYIYDMTTMQQLREADLAEIQEAKASLESTSAPTIVIDDIMFLVATKSGVTTQSTKTEIDKLKPDADDTTVKTENVLDNFLSQLNDSQRAELVKKLMASESSAS